MKITKSGTNPKDRIWVGTCRSCGSEAEATEGELSPQYPQLDGPFAWHECPVCGAGKGNGYGGMIFYPRSHGSRQ